MSGVSRAVTDTVTAPTAVMFREGAGVVASSGDGPGAVAENALNPRSHSVPALSDGPELPENTGHYLRNLYRPGKMMKLKEPPLRM